jgi:hypothetical protein
MLTVHYAAYQIGIGRLFNHSNKDIANAKIQRVRSNKLMRPIIMIWSTKLIRRGDEITWTYAGDAADASQLTSLPAHMPPQQTDDSAVEGKYEPDAPAAQLHTAVADDSLHADAAQQQHTAVADDSLHADAAQQQHTAVDNDAAVNADAAQQHTASPHADAVVIEQTNISA